MHVTCLCGMFACGLFCICGVCLVCDMCDLGLCGDAMCGTCMVWYGYVCCVSMCYMWWVWYGNVWCGWCSCGRSVVGVWCGCVWFACMVRCVGVWYIYSVRCGVVCVCRLDMIQCKQLSLIIPLQGCLRAPSTWGSHLPKQPDNPTSSLSSHQDS